MRFSLLRLRAHHHQRLPYRAGFSIVEFIVILTLFAIMTGVVFFDFNRFRDTIEVDTLASDIALAMHQVQVFGISASNQLVGNTEFDDQESGLEDLANRDLTLDEASYGLQIQARFGEDETDEIVLYEDLNENSRYDAGGDRVVDRLTLRSGQYGIIEVCLSESTQGVMRVDQTTGLCETGSGITSETDADIDFVFKRPFPDVYIQGGALIREALIVVGRVQPGVEYPETGTVSKRYILVSSSGLISIHEADEVN